jgi:hypothetical protein
LYTKRPARDTGIIGGKFGWRRDRTVTHWRRGGTLPPSRDSSSCPATTTRLLGTRYAALDPVVEVGDVLAATTSVRAPGGVASSPAGPLPDQVGDEADPDRIEDTGPQALPDDARAGDSDDPVARLVARLVERRLDVFGDEVERGVVPTVRGAAIVDKEHCRPVPRIKRRVGKGCHGSHRH